MSANTLWSLEKATEAAKGIQFWRSEYMKRQLMSEPEYDNIVLRYNEFSAEWRNYLKRKNASCCTAYQYGFMRHLQVTYVDILIDKDYFDANTGIFFQKEFGDFFTNPSIVEDLRLFNEISENYDYCIDDPVSPLDMATILTDIDKNLPEPPFFFMNKHYHHIFTENVLTLLRLNGEVDVKAPQKSSWRNVFGEIVSPYQYGDNIQIEGFRREADFAILGQALHDEFDLELAMQEIRDHLTWTIYESKRKYNLPLKENEEKAVIDLYKRMAFGEYGPKHKAARAIGLWLWDTVHKTKCPNSFAVRKLQEQCLHTEHEASDNRTLLRLLDIAKKCVDSGEVQAITGKSGRPRKK